MCLYVLVSASWIPIGSFQTTISLSYCGVSSHLDFFRDRHVLVIGSVFLFLVGTNRSFFFLLFGRS